MHYINSQQIVAFLLGICITLWLPVLPDTMSAIILAIITIAGIWLRPNKIVSSIAIATLGFAFMSYQVNRQLGLALPENLEGQVITVIGTISSVVEEKSEHELKFLFTVSCDKPWLVELVWQQPPQPLYPGDKWALSVKLKRPRSYANWGSFDSEKYYFQRRIVATGYVQAVVDNKRLNSTWFIQFSNKIRQKLLTILQRRLAAREFKGIITALVLGNRSLITPQQLQILQNSGTAHLMSISGMHIGMVATLVFFALRMLWRFVLANSMQISAPWLAACGALTCASIYALLAGFSLATQRSLIMLSLLLCGVIFKRKIAALQRFLLALLLVLLWDPFVILSAGFWLSFCAVGSLLYSFVGRNKMSHKHFKLLVYIKPQLVISLFLLPFTLLFFAQSPMLSLLINLIAIPWICFIVVPSSLCGALIVAERSFACLWPLLHWCSNLPVYYWQAPEKFSIIYLGCALFGALWIFIPVGIPGRVWGMLCFMPLFFLRSHDIELGTAQFILLDVGQGLAAVVRTSKHVLVYDTGAKKRSGFDLGSKVVAPYLQTLGVKQIDKLLISHGDNDHIGGAEGLINKITAHEVMLNEPHYLPQHNNLTACLAGTHWIWDGVEFTILHPEEFNVRQKRNDQSCVLMVQAGTHKLLLTGDIEAKSERQLVARYGSALKANILLVPHHGSKTSSSVEFINQVQPQFALIPVGYKNQYGHPKEEVLARYNAEGIHILRTESSGSISFVLGYSHPFALQPMQYRLLWPNFWAASSASFAG